MSGFKYTYKGDHEREVTSKILSGDKDSKIVKPGEVFESTDKINNPDFELQGQQSEQPKQEIKKEEVTK